MNWGRWATATAICFVAQILWLPDLLPQFLRPDLVLLLVLWTAVRGGVMEAMVVAVGLGILYDSCVLSPLVGAGALGLLAVAFLPTALERQLLTGNYATLAGLAGAGTFAADAVRYLLYQGAGHLSPGVPFLVASTVWDRSVVAVAVAVPFALVLDRLVLGRAGAHSERERYASKTA